MVTLNELCDITAGSSLTSDCLRQACALPRFSAEKGPLPVPHTEFPFDSSWEALFMGTDLVAQETTYCQ